jgi:hypothetical protein
MTLTARGRAAVALAALIAAMFATTSGFARQTSIPPVLRVSTSAVQQAVTPQVQANGADNAILDGLPIDEVLQKTNGLPIDEVQAALVALAGVACYRYRRTQPGTARIPRSRTW